MFIAGPPMKSNLDEKSAGKTADLPPGELARIYYPWHFQDKYASQETKHLGKQSESIDPSSYGRQHLYPNDFFLPPLTPRVARTTCLSGSSRPSGTTGGHRRSSTLKGPSSPTGRSSPTHCSRILSLTPTSGGPDNSLSGSPEGRQEAAGNLPPQNKSPPNKSASPPDPPLQNQSPRLP